MRAAAMLGLLLASYAEAQQLELAVLDTIKAATAFISAGDVRGSGFLANVSDQSGWVVTNAHIVAGAVERRQRVTAVLGSGSGGDRSFAARVVVLDEHTDLAILRIEGANLPKALAIDSDALMQETMPVWVVGFPFGEALSVGDANPAPTITATQISSIRANALGAVEAVQTAGGINIGNSGGPIVNARGNVLGVAVAKLLGTDIGFGIPFTIVEDTLAGRIASANAVMTMRAGGVAEIAITARCIDPQENIKRVVAMILPVSRLSGRLKLDSRGRPTGPISSSMTEVALTYRDSSASGMARLKLPKGVPEEVVVQFRCQRKSGAQLFTEYFSCRLGDAGARGVAIASKVKSTAPNIQQRLSGGRRPVVSFSWEPSKVTVVTPPAQSAVVGRTVRDANGRRFTAVTAKGTTLDLGPDVLQVAACPTGKCVYVIRQREPVVFVVDPITWKTVEELPTPEFPKSIWADSSLIAVACDKSRVVALIDAQKRSILASCPLPDLGDYIPDTVIGRAPDGSIMSLWQLEGGAWWDRTLVHVSVDGQSRIMIKDEPIYWATWLLDGTGIATQGSFAASPSGTFDLAFPEGPKNFAELHNNKLFGTVGFHSDTAQAFLSADRRTLVVPRTRVQPRDWQNASGKRPEELVDDRRASGASVAWTYLISPAFDEIVREFPGRAFVELPEHGLYISVGTIAGKQPVCYYVSTKDGRVVREIALEWPQPSDHVRWDHKLVHAWGTDSRPVFVAGHELLLMSNPNAIQSKLPRTITAFRCGPIANAPVEAEKSSAPVNDPPTTAAVGEETRYVPVLPPEVKASAFRLKRALAGMTINARTGEWVWQPGREHVGQWTVTILATVDGKETALLTWTVKVQ